jgi:hypothetical protein
VDVIVNMDWRLCGCLYERMGDAFDVEVDTYCTDYF